MRTKLATAARWARQRPRTNQQGIALQTVIVIVVMLVIAGAVAGVLFSRSQDVIGDLESTSVAVGAHASATACESAGHRLLTNTSSSVSPGTAAGTAVAIIHNSVDVECYVVGPDAVITSDRCSTAGGTHGSLAGANDSCTFSA